MEIDYDSRLSETIVLRLILKRSVGGFGQNDESVIMSYNHGEILSFSFYLFSYQQPITSKLELIEICKGYNVIRLISFEIVGFRLLVH